MVENYKYHVCVVLVAQMNHPCQSSAIPMASTAASVSPLQPWGAAKEATTIAPSPWSTVSCPLKTSSMTSAPTARTVSLSHQGHFRHCPDISLSSPAWSTLTLAFPSWPRAAGLGSTLQWGSPWHQPTAQAQTSPQEAAEDTQTFQPVLPLG